MDWTLEIQVTRKSRPPSPWRARPSGEVPFDGTRHRVQHLGEMRWRPFDKPLEDLSIDDLERLRDEKIEESLFLEYKSQWSSGQIAKSIAGFANTEGGTLVVGMTTTGRTPVELVGLEHSGDIGESLDQVVRSSIAPRPAFHFRVVQNRAGKPCLVVEIPRATNGRPYLVTTTGQVMRRTQTATEPATREYLDRLFLEGRAGERWAREHALSSLESPRNAAYLWTIPAVDGGLALGTSIFTQEFWQRLVTLARRFEWVGRYGPGPLRQHVADTYLDVSVVDSIDTTLTFYLRSYTTGVVESIYTPEEHTTKADAITVAKRMVESALPLHRKLLVDGFEFRGRTILALQNTWRRELASGDHETGRLAFMHPEFVLADELEAPEFADGLKRQIERAAGEWSPEPGT